MLFLVWSSVLIKWRCEKYQWIGLISKFCSFPKINQSLNHFRIFIVNKEQGVSRVSFRTLSQKKNDRSNVQNSTHRIPMLWYRKCIFFISFYHNFNFDIIRTITIVLLESSLCYTSWLLHQRTNLIFLAGCNFLMATFHCILKLVAKNSCSMW